MNKLFATVVKHSDKSGALLALETFPNDLLDEQEIECKTWLVDFAHEYDKFPSEQTILDKYPEFAGFVPSVEPIDYVKQDMVKRKKDQKTVSVANRINEAVALGKPYDDLLNELSNVNSISEKSAYNFSDYEVKFHTKQPGINLGFSVFDKSVGGLSEHETLVIAARPNVGKTNMLMNVVYNAMIARKRILLVSGEQSVSTLIDKMIAMRSGINPNIVRYSTNDLIYTDEQREDFRSALEALQGYNNSLFYIGGSLSIDTIKNMARRHAVDLVAIDAVYNLKKTKYVNDAYQSIMGTVQGVVDMTNELPIRTVMSTQFNRNGVGVPELSDLAFSDAFAQSPDFVLGLRRVQENQPYKLILKLMKNRLGSQVGVETSIDVNPNSLRFVEV